jgi:hypothetical protein
MTKIKEDFCHFIGQKAFEDDGGWSWEVWQAAYVAALQGLEDRFKRLDDTLFHADEVASEIQELKDSHAKTQK